VLGTLMKRRQGFTLVELLIVIAVVAVILALAGPSFRDFILVQRLKGTSSQLVTDFQYARSEAIARNRPVFIEFKAPSSSSPMSCYTIYTDTSAPRWEARTPGYHLCDCTQAAGSRCPTTSTELRTQQIPSDSNVALSMPTSTAIAFDPVTGSTSFWVPDQPNQVPQPFTVTAAIDTERRISTVVEVTGRPQNCLPSGATVTGYTAC
jgi:type IV fimbrial biogenesis protein FimT